MRSIYFSTMLVTQALLLAVTPVIFILSLNYENLVITRLNLVLLWLFQAGFFIHWLHRPFRRLGELLENLDEAGGVSGLVEKQKYVLGMKAEREFGRISGFVNRLRLEREREYHLYHNCIERALTGLMAVDETGKVLVVNRAFSSILEFRRPDSLDRLDEVKEGLAGWISSVQSDTQKMLTLVVNGKILKVYISVGIFRQDGRLIRIIAIQDITPGVAAQQLETMHRFLRMMSHEILNSVTPVSLMASGLIRKHREAGKCPDCGGAVPLQDVSAVEVLDSIRKRSRGLAAFVESFRRTYHIPEPVPSDIAVEDLFRQMELLFGEQLQCRGIKLITGSGRPGDRLTADRKLIEQVLINVVLNAMDAVSGSEQPEVGINFMAEQEKTVIEVSDNGHGMDRETLERLSLPFYTTKEKGTGSGLYFSRQVMRLHKGELEIHSEKGKGTVVRLIFWSPLFARSTPG